MLAIVCLYGSHKITCRGSFSHSTMNFGGQTQVSISANSLAPDPDSGDPWKELRGLNSLGSLLAIIYSSDSLVDWMVASVRCSINRSGIPQPNC